MTKTLTLPDVREKLVGLGFDLIGGSPEEFTALIKADLTRYAKLVKDTGMKAD